MVLGIDGSEPKLLWEIVPNLLEALVEMVIGGLGVPWSDTIRFGPARVSAVLHIRILVRNIPSTVIVRPLIHIGE